MRYILIIFFIFIYLKTSNIFAEGIYLTYFLICKGKLNYNKTILENAENFKEFSYENFEENFYINGTFSLNNPQGYLSADEFFTIDVRKIIY